MENKRPGKIPHEPQRFTIHLDDEIDTATNTSSKQNQESMYCKSQQDGHVGGGQGVRYDTDAHAGLQVRLDADVKIC